MTVQSPGEHNFQLLQERTEKLKRIAERVSAMLLIDDRSPTLPRWDRAQLIEVWKDVKEYTPADLRDRLAFLP